MSVGAGGEVDGMRRRSEGGRGNGVSFIDLTTAINIIYSPVIFFNTNRKFFVSFPGKSTDLS